MDIDSAKRHPSHMQVRNNQSFYCFIELGLIDCYHSGNHEICLNPCIRGVKRLQSSPILTSFSAEVPHSGPIDKLRYINQADIKTSMLQYLHI